MKRLGNVALGSAAGSRGAVEELPLLGEAQIWLGRVGEWAGSDLATDVLSQSELERRDRFRFGADRARFVGRRVFLRGVLSRYLPTTAGGVRLTSASHGKLELSPRSDLQFNLSHSDGLALLAVARRLRVGIDIERIRPLPDAQQIAERFFTDTELRALAEAKYGSRFFSYWTRNEAYIKAAGGGLAIPLRSFDVAAGNPFKTMRLNETSSAEVFSLVSIAIEDGYAAAVALEGEQLSVTTVREWTPWL